MLDDNLDLWVLSSPFCFVKSFTAGLCLLASDFFAATVAHHEVWETWLRAELLNFAVLPFLGFPLSSLCEKSRSLSNWSTCGHTAFCTLKSYSLLFVLLSCIGPFSVEQDFVALILYKYWKKIKSPSTGSLAVWEMFCALTWTCVNKWSKWISRRRGNLSMHLVQSLL